MATTPSAAEIVGEPLAVAPAVGAATERSRQKADRRQAILSAAATITSIGANSPRPWAMKP